MATAVHSGYTIAATSNAGGTNGSKVEVWAEYYIDTANHTSHYRPLTVYFYTATKSGYTTGTSYVGGLNSSCSVNGIAGTGVSAGNYDFTSSSVTNFLGSWSGNISFSANGTASVPFSCTFTTKSSYITGITLTGNISVSYSCTYTVTYNGGTPSAQTKNYGTTLTLSSTKPSKSSTTSTGYKVTFNANGGSCSTSSLSATNTTTYAFSTWNTASDGTGTSYSSGGKYSTEASVTLYPIYTSSTTKGSITLPTPTRSGWTFLGWSTSSTNTSSGSSAGASYTPSSDVTLYANWSKSITLTYNVNGGSGSIASQSATIYNGTTSYTFTLSSTKPSKSSTTSTGYTVTFNANGGSCSTSSLSATNTTTYTFSGWSTSSSATSSSYSAGGTISISSSTTIYAVYTSSTTKGSIILPTASKSGYTMRGWSTSSTATSGTAAGSSYTPASSTTLYAVWTAITYYIAFNANGGSGSMSNMTCAYGNSYTLTTNTFTRESHNFLGWATSISGSVVYADQDTVSNLTTTSGGTYTLYAVWEYYEDTNGVVYVKVNGEWIEATKIDVALSTEAVECVVNPMDDDSGNIFIGIPTNGELMEIKYLILSYVFHPASSNEVDSIISGMSKICDYDSTQGFFVGPYIEGSTSSFVITVDEADAYIDYIDDACIELYYKFDPNLLLQDYGTIIQLSAIAVVGRKQ